MTPSTVEMCRNFAVLHIGHWRESRAQGLPKSAAYSRGLALWWLAAMKGKRK